MSGGAALEKLGKLMWRVLDEHPLPNEWFDGTSRKWGEVLEEAFLGAKSKGGKREESLAAALEEMCRCFEFSLKFSVQGKNTKIGKAYQAAMKLLAVRKEL